MDKVYIITSGDYSDYHIERVFQSKEKTEIYAKARNKFASIETFELSDDCIDKLTVTGKFLRGDIAIGRAPGVWLDYDCRHPDEYISMGEHDEYCFVSEELISGVYVCHLVMGKFIPKDQWREQETIDRFSKVLTDKMAEVKSMLADGLTIDTINQVWGKRYYEKR